jgi:uncharacterized repeat protein (TIGR04138 family)
MQEEDFDEVIEQVLARDPRYPREAYLFLRDALEHTQQQVARQAKGTVRHVTGQELLQGIREFALEQFGPMALTVFDDWGIRAGEDFGEMVFNMVGARLLAKTDRDNLADFRGVYDFDEAFRKPFLPPSKLAPNPAARVA